MPSEDVSFGRLVFLVFLDQANELRIADHFVRQTESLTLPHPDKRSRGLVQLCKEAPPHSAVLWLVSGPTCPRQELEQAPDPSVDLNWLFCGCGYRPSLSVQTGKDLKFVGDVRERLI